jgi:hypothetical protein
LHAQKWNRLLFRLSIGAFERDFCTQRATAGCRGRSKLLCRLWIHIVFHIFIFGQIIRVRECTRKGECLRAFGDLFNLAVNWRGGGNRPDAVRLHEYLHTTPMTGPSLIEVTVFKVAKC